MYSLEKNKVARMSFKLNLENKSWVFYGFASSVLKTNDQNDLFRNAVYCWRLNRTHLSVPGNWTPYCVTAPTSQDCGGKRFVFSQRDADTAGRE